MYKSGAKAKLLINGKQVGTVTVQGRGKAWSHGRFEPEPDSFAEFAPIFGRWSILMHADEQSVLSEAASEELRATENELDRLHAELYFPDLQESHHCTQLNIDGELIEWVEY
jgi:hypothetical protein